MKSMTYYVMVNICFENYVINQALDSCSLRTEQKETKL